MLIIYIYMNMCMTYSIYRIIVQAERNWPKELKSWVSHVPMLLIAVLWSNLAILLRSFG